MDIAVRGQRPGARWHRIAHGLYVPPKPESERAFVEDLHAWSLVLPPLAAFTHLTAARVRGWWSPRRMEQPVYAAVPKGGNFPCRPGLRISRPVSAPSAYELSGVRVVGGAETILSATRDLGVLDLVVLGDSALRLGHCTVEDLMEICTHRRAGSVRLRRVIPLLDPRSESAWESIMRVLHQQAGIDVEPQKRIVDADGQFVARADLWLVGTSRIHEYDGEIHRNGEVHRQDLRRDRRLVGAGVQRLGYTSHELLQEGGSIIDGVDRLLGRRWDPARLRRWNALIADSLHGRRRLV